MADDDPKAGELTTANYGWTKPTVGASDDQWGGYLNADLDGIDSVVHGIQTSVPAASTTTPVMDGTAAVGTGTTWARADHVHPTDTSRAAVSAIPAASTAPPIMNGTAAVGTGTTWARADHVHPTDTSLLPLAGGTLTGTLNGTSANFSASLNGLSVAAGVGGPGSLYPAYALDTTFVLTGSGTARSLQFTTGYTIAADKTPLTIAFHIAGGLAATFDSGGGLTITGANAVKAGGGSWTAPSDERIKTVESNYTQGLDAVLALDPVVYRYKGNASTTKDSETFPRASATSHVGLIAQAVETVMPEMVTMRAGYIDGEPVDDLRDLDTTPLIFALVNAVKTLSARVEALEAAQNG